MWRQRQTVCPEAQLGARQGGSDASHGWSVRIQGCLPFLCQVFGVPALARDGSGFVFRQTCCETEELSSNRTRVFIVSTTGAEHELDTTAKVNSTSREQLPSDGH